MALLRCLHAADLPDPGALAKRLDEIAANPRVAPAGDAVPRAPAAPAALDWAELVRSVENAGQLRAAQIMRDWVRVVVLVPGELRYSLVPGYSGDPHAGPARGAGQGDRRALAGCRGAG